MIAESVRNTKSLYCNPFHSFSECKNFSLPTVASIIQYKNPTPKMNALVTDIKLSTVDIY